MFRFRRRPKYWQHWPRKPAPIGPETLRIMAVDKLFKHNGYVHKTDMFDLMSTRGKTHLVVRRGESITIQLTLNRPFNPDTDSIYFILRHQLAEYPSVGSKTMVVMPVLHYLANSNTSWSAFIVSSTENIITAIITSSADSIIGKWFMEIDAKVNHEGSTTYKCREPIYILFNAWCKEDAVYIDETAKREEYILTEIGMMWFGQVNQPEIKVWKYGQFDEYILDCSLMLLGKVSKLPLILWNDPVMVGRAISAAVNSTDDNGVLQGNWTKDFRGGKNPGDWIGSQEILRKYYESQKPVKYGQCYVFAGVATTVFRALGIPARPTTCFNSAHDHGCSLTLDIHIDDKGEEINRYNKDMIWNYHVWTEIWTKRPDLGAAYDGWQVIDSTPQELSDNLYRCGPAPVSAVKKAEIKRPYDVDFVYSEVNADIAYWKMQEENQPVKLLKTDTSGIGQFISTKAVGSFEREDVTNQYKYQENTKEERSAFLNALRISNNMISRYYLNQNFGNVMFDLQMQEDTLVGSSYSVNLIAKNLSKTDHNVTIFLRITIKNYNGELINEIKKDEDSFVVTADSERIMTMVLNYRDYAPFMKLGGTYHVSALSKIDGTDYEYFAQDVLRIKLPSLTIKVEETPVVNTNLKGSAFFNNPLPVKLKENLFLIRMHGVNKEPKYKIKNVPPNGEAKTDFELLPTIQGKQTIIVEFHSNKLPNINGNLNVEVSAGA